MYLWGPTFRVASKQKNGRLSHNPYEEFCAES